MSSYLTGWQSQEYQGLEDIYGHSTSLNTSIKHHQSLNVSSRQVQKGKKENKKGKYLLPPKKHSTMIENKVIQKKEINIVAFNPYFKKFKSKIASEMKLHKKFLKAKQNMENQLTKKTQEIKNKFGKQNSDVKLSVVNVFERLQFQKPELCRHFDEIRRRQTSLHRMDHKKSSPSRKKSIQRQKQKQAQKKQIKMQTRYAENKFKYINLTSFEVIHQQRNKNKYFTFEKLNKIASESNMRRYME